MTPVANVSDQAFLMKGYPRGGGLPMLFASPFLPAPKTFASHVREVVRRVPAMAATDKGARYARLRRSPHKKVWKP